MTRIGRWLVAALVVALCASCFRDVPLDPRAYPDSDRGSLEDLADYADVWMPEDMSSVRFSAAFSREVYFALTFESSCEASEAFRVRNRLTVPVDSPEDLSLFFHDGRDRYAWTLGEATGSVAWRGRNLNQDFTEFTLPDGTCRSHYVLFTS